MQFYACISLHQQTIYDTFGKYYVSRHTVFLCSLNLVDLQYIYCWSFYAIMSFYYREIITSNESILCNILQEFYKLSH
jgi:hypothetical protein